MSENTLEDIKKICLICGCHTKQAINIYEPRNGPNIIELIQAKFKFQPVNDDKYLCYSCNNWLINWHSLQTLNNSSNNESSNYGHSSKSRSHYIRNESIPEEECNDHNVIKIRNGCQNFYNYEKNHDHKRDNDEDKAADDDDDNDYKKKDNNGRNLLNNISKQKRMGFYFPRRNCIKWRRIRKVRRKYKQYRSCSFCGRSLKTHLPIRYRGLSKKITIKCKTCSRILEWSSNYTKSLLNEENRKLKEFNIINNINNHHIHNNYNNKNNENDNNNCNINNTIIINNNKNNKNLLNNDNNHKTIKNFNTNINNGSLVINNNRYHYSHHYHPHHQRPLIDGKVVAMLRRLGTTLTRESDCIDNIDTKLQNNMTAVAAAAKSNYLIKNNNEYQQQQQQLLQLQHQQYQKNLSFSHNNICLNYNNNNNNNNCNLNKREMEDNEILIDFNTAITEVLQPFDLVKYQITSSTLSSLNIMKLTNKNPDVEIIDVENDKNTGQDQQEQEQQQQQQPQLSLEAIYKRIPKCVTISVISSSSSDSDGGIIVGSNNNVDGIIGSGNNNHHKNSSSAIVEN